MSSSPMRCEAYCCSDVTRKWQMVCLFCCRRYLRVCSYCNRSRIYCVECARMTPTYERGGDISKLDFD